MLHKKLGVSAGHAEEFVCNHLKTRDNHCDVLLENQPLYTFEIDKTNPNGGTRFLQHKYKKPSVDFEPPPLEGSESNLNPYVPFWVGGCFGQAGGKVHLSNDKMDEKLAITQSNKKPTWYEPYSSKDLFSMNDVKILLNKSCFYVMVDVVEMTRLHLGTRKELLLSPNEGIRVEGDQTNGWTAFPGESLMNVLGTAYVGQNEVRVPKRSHVGVHSVSNNGTLRYISARHAKFSLMFHLLFNVQSKQVTHWCSTYLQGRPEFVLLVRFYGSKYSSDLVCSIFRSGGVEGDIMYKVFNDAENDFMRGELVRTGW